jgi:DNA uptake protein ComE-like DNA-binding protein
MDEPRLWLVALFVTVVAAAACKPGQPSAEVAEYRAICDGPPLRSAEAREDAMQKGLEIDPRLHCVTKRSVQVLAEQKAQYEAANTPEAKAARQAEIEREMAEYKVRLEADLRAEAEARAERERQWALAEAKPIEPVEINTATESQLANVQGIDAKVARQIVAERAKGRFDGWPDVVHRVVGLSAAETAARASAFGLTVNGRSLEGAEPDSVIGRFAREKWRRRGAA